LVTFFTAAGAGLCAGFARGRAAGRGAGTATDGRDSVVAAVGPELAVTDGGRGAFVTGEGVAAAALGRSAFGAFDGVVVVVIGGSGVGTGIAAVEVRVVGRGAEVPPLGVDGDAAFVAVNPPGGSSGCGEPPAATAGHASATMQPLASTISRHRRRDEAPVDMSPSRSLAP
jgi:hypothetical protein